jgi:hypothetical protein
MDGNGDYQAKQIKPGSEGKKEEEKRMRESK